MSATDSALSTEEQMSLSRIRRVLGVSYDREERERAVEAFLPYLWKRTPWVNYRARCMLTTYVYLPFGLHFLEWMSLPHQFAKALREQGHGTLPATHCERRQAVVETLQAMLNRWIFDYTGAPNPLSPQPTVAPLKTSKRPPNMDMGASICEVIGRLGIHEAHKTLVWLLPRVSEFDNVVRRSVLEALSYLPPEQIPHLWQELKEADPRVRPRLAAVFRYLYNPAAVPFLLDVLEHQDERFMASVVQPLLARLGEIGDPRALPMLNQIARDENHPERPTAIRAIQRLMKQAEGQEEVTLLRGSSAATLDQDALLRAVEEAPEAANAWELLRSTTPETQPLADSPAPSREAAGPMQGMQE